MGFGGWEPNYALCAVTLGNVAGKPSYGSSAMSQDGQAHYMGSNLLRGTSPSGILPVLYNSNNYGLYLPHMGDNIYSTNYMYTSSSSTGAAVNYCYRPTVIRITWLAAKKF